MNLFYSHSPHSSSNSTKSHHLPLTSSSQSILLFFNSPPFPVCAVLSWATYWDHPLRKIDSPAPRNHQLSATTYLRVDAQEHCPLNANMLIDLFVYSVIIPKYYLKMKMYYSCVRCKKILSYILGSSIS